MHRKGFLRGSPGTFVDVSWNGVPVGMNEAELGTIRGSSIGAKVARCGYFLLFLFALIDG